MKRLLLLTVLLLAASISASAQTNTKLQDYAEAGNKTVNVGGVNSSSSTPVQRTLPSATITVFNAGTATLSTIFSNAAGAAKANPFTAASDGYWFFYGPSGTHYDIQFAATGATTFTRGDFIAPVDSSGGGGGTFPSITLTGSGVIIDGGISNLIDSLAVGANNPQRVGINHGTPGLPISSTGTTVTIERFDATNGVGTVANFVSSVRKSGTMDLAIGLLGLGEIISTGASKDVVGVAGFAGSGLAASPISTGKAFGLYGDSTLWSNQGQANAAELDIRNHTGVVAPAISAAGMPAGATVGLAITGKISVAGSSNYTVGLVFQNGTAPAWTGIHFDTTSLVSTGFGIDFKYTTQGIPIRLPNTNVNTGGFIVARNGADNANRKLIGMNSSNIILMGSDGDVVLFGSSIRPGIGTFATNTAQVYATAAQGLALAGQTGSVYDFSLFTPAGVALLQNPTSTNDLEVPNNLRITGNIQSTGIAFAALGTPGNGQFTYCTDCQVTSGASNVCATAGTGAFALRINGAWRCFAAQN